MKQQNNVVVVYQQNVATVHQQIIRELAEKRGDCAPTESGDRVPAK